MCITTFSVDYKPPLNTVQLMVFGELVLHENTELLPSGYSYELYPGNNDTTVVIMLVLVWIPVNNKLGLAEVAK